ncbi:CerR family C-terminal domain-containing protein [Rhodoplanes sp. TEM]|uniref:CerR family C-terminal domain-containing protein n=1 Tax=Rhodoplanes tepidamans TaxID=200616 RepID=A0ABT5J441_RHOTP|nr:MULTISPECIES: CerR family C-terminal domain-containing protein [Rhodoplanes]MDC7784410.1 CerR family C-terminal domain-containing protein [Rhodoplanes tepidamans]MDC7984103.1 CerR family C-terminal domain-containing protein [Rhodoplanes sp. TEM]MDQ0356917.1 AcrR family transcriptional regulator [Rhodoplanes tepidamans]
METPRHEFDRITARRPALTRERLLRAALAVFADHGYAGASVRRICQRARANPAAVKHYFGNKEGLYQEVLHAAATAFAGDTDGFGEPDERPPEEMLRDLIRHQLRPVLRRNTIGRYLKVFAWEDMAPSRPYKQFLASGRSPGLTAANAIARKLLPRDASNEEIAIATAWLMNQAMPFVRSRDAYRAAPFGLRYDQAMVERLADRLTHLALTGLAGRPRRLD